MAPNLLFYQLLPADLVVERLSESNTAAEMHRQRREYVAAGVRLAWFVDPLSRTVAVYTTVDQSTLLSAYAKLILYCPPKFLITPST